MGTGVAFAVSDGINLAAVIEAALSGRIAEARVLDHYNEFHQQRADYLFEIVKYVYNANHLFADQPFWAARRTRPETGGITDRAIMERLALDSSARYFRDAFVGMGIDDSVLSPIDQHLNAGDRPVEAASRALRAPYAWIPKVRKPDDRKLRVNFDNDLRLVEGVGSDDYRTFFFNPVVVEALRDPEAELTIQEIVTRGAQAARPGTRLRTRFELLAQIAGACGRGFLDLMPAQPTSPAARRPKASISAEVRV